MQRITRGQARRGGEASANSSSSSPPTGADTVVSIFIAERTTSGAPALTTEPDLASTSTTSPAIGAPTDPRAETLAFSRMALVAALAASDFLSRTSTTRGRPLVSKKTSRHPLG